MSNLNDKQLTPEEYAYKLFPIEEGNIEDDINFYKRKIFFEGIKFSARQIASKDEEISALRELFTNCASLLQGFPISEPGEFGIGGKHNEWYNRRCDILASFGMIGTGILRWRQTKDEQIKELEDDLKNALVLLKGTIPHLYNHGLVSVRAEANEIRHFTSSIENKKKHD